MTARQLTIDHLLSGGLITNYSCTSRCRHCLYRSGPQWPKEFIDQETARANLMAIKTLGCSAIHLGGGEPLLKPAGVAAVLETARDLGVQVEYVETNAAWFKNQADARAILKLLTSLGLSTLLVSISPLHNEFIPFAKVKGLIKACRAAGVRVLPWSADFMGDLAEFDERKPHRLGEYQLRFGRDYLARLPQRYWIAPGGRALETFDPLLPQRPLADLTDGSGCDELAGVTHFHLDLYGNYIPGLCAGLAIRRDDLGRPLAAADYPILTALYREGVGGLARYAAATGIRPQQKSYGTKCALCYELRRALHRQGIQSHELRPSTHYQAEPRSS